MRVFIFGMPKGQARTQLLQAIQRGFLADCTTPSPVRLIAWTGHTSAHVGESQCTQKTPVTQVVRRRAVRSGKHDATEYRLIIPTIIVLEQAPFLPNYFEEMDLKDFGECR